VTDCQRVEAVGSQWLGAASQLTPPRPIANNQINKYTEPTAAAIASGVRIAGATITVQSEECVLNLPACKLEWEVGS
jgi:hypothetical protein